MTTFELVISDREPGGQVALAGSDRSGPRKGAPSGGPLKITDPDAFRRMMADMEAKTKAQKDIEFARETERARREGDAYLSPEERLARAKPRYVPPPESEGGGALEDAARGGANASAGTFDPDADYYGDLGLDRGASSGEVRAAYRSVALLYHPDKHSGVTGARYDAIRERFLGAREASRVLSDERLRAAYDRVLDFRAAGGGGRALPALSPEERAMVARGAGELARLRRQAPALGPAPTRGAQVALTLEQLDAGGAGELELRVRRVDAGGVETELSLPLAVPFRAGSRPGDVVVLRAAGDEAVDASRGDVAVTLAARPHRALRPRAGAANDLDAYAGAAEPGAAWAILEVPTPDGVGRLLSAPLLEHALLGGPGFALTRVLRGAGLRDHAEPFRAPRGDVHATLRVAPAPRSAPGKIRPLLATRGAILLVAGARDPVSGAFAGAALGDTLHREALRDDILEPEPTAGAGAGAGASRARHARRSAAVLLGPAADGPCPAAAAAVRAARLAPSVVRISGPASALLDEEALAAEEADVLILDDSLAGPIDGPARDDAGPPARGGDAAADDAVDVECSCRMASGAPSPVEVAREFAFCTIWRGRHVLATGRALAALGLSTGGEDAAVQASSGDLAATRASSGGRAVLPFYVVRPSDGETGGWGGLRIALGRSVPGTMGVGALAGGVVAVDATTGAADTIVAPPRDALMARARAESTVTDKPDEADDDFGFLYAVVAS